MFNDNIFRIAFTLSLSLHLFALSAGVFFLGKPPVDKTADIIEVIYLLPDTGDAVLENSPEIYDLKDAPTKQKEHEATVTDSESLAKSDAAVSNDEYLDENQQKALEEYIQYYELIREKIKKVVKKSYTNFNETGSVELSFALDKKGVLLDARVNPSTSSGLTLSTAEGVNKTKSAQSAYLCGLAVRSLRNASPFPPFPQTLAKEQLSFLITIIFKKE